MLFDFVLLVVLMFVSFSLCVFVQLGLDGHVCLKRLGLLRGNARCFSCLLDLPYSGLGPCCGWRLCSGVLCRSGVFMAMHFNRYYCGKCHLTYLIKKEAGQVQEGFHLASTGRVNFN